MLSKPFTFLLQILHFVETICQKCQNFVYRLCGLHKQEAENLRNEFDQLQRKCKLLEAGSMEAAAALEAVNLAIWCPILLCSALSSVKPTLLMQAVWFS